MKPYKNPNLRSAFKVAWTGIWGAIRHERNFRIHLSAALLVLVAGWLLKITAQDWLWLILAIFSVLIMELVNTAIETVVDLVVGDKYDLQAKKAKDIAAGAVTLTALASAIIGLIIFWPYLENFWH